VKIPKKIMPYDSEYFCFFYSDTESYLLPFFQLRFFCPCASCVDEMTGQRILKETSIPKGVSPKKVTPVGRYAVQILWSDSHSTGIFHYDRIYELCLKLGQKMSNRNTKEDL